MRGRQVRTCENEGTSVGGKPCPNEATHRALLRHDGDDYETFLCPTCFAGFREEMIANGLHPKNDATLRQGVDK